MPSINDSAEKKSQPVESASAAQTSDAVASGAVIGTASPVRTFLSDAAISGGVTWIGTVLSIVAAVIAFRQARAAITAVASVKAEQNRQYVEIAMRHLTQLDQTIKPILMKTTTERGVDVSRLASLGTEICHTLLSSPAVTIIPTMQVSVEKIESSLQGINAAFMMAKAGPANVAPLLEIQKSIKADIQTLSRSCINFIDQRALPASL